MCSVQKLIESSIGTLLPIRASGRTHRPRAPNINPTDIQRDNSPDPPLALRPIPVLPVPAQYILPPCLRQQPPPIPDSQALRPAVHTIMRPGRIEPLAMVSSFLETNHPASVCFQLAAAVPG